jgi:hypothetical protein
MMSKTTEETLKWVIESLREEGWVDTDGIIKACEDCLAELALDRMAENARELGLDYSAQEPVAEVQEVTIGQSTKSIKFANLKDLPVGTKLYTHPAPQPLSDEEITEILVKHGLDNVEMASKYIDVVLLMRDVEQAHGIGEKDAD